MKKWLLGAVAASGLFLASCGRSPEVASTEAGRVREDELYERMKNEVTQSGMTFGEQMLQQILLEDILAEAYDDEVTEEEIDELYTAEAEQFGGVEEFENTIENQGLSADEVRDSLRMTLHVRRAVENHVEITEEDIQAAYDEYEVLPTVAHILVEEEELAQDIISQVNDGAEFGELVSEHSIDHGTVPANGELPLEQGRFVPEFEEAANQLEEGEVTQEPVATEYGYHIIKLVDNGEKGTFEEERENIEDMLIESYLNDPQVVQEAVGELVRNANVQITDEELSGAMQQFMATPELPTEEPGEEPVEEDATDETDTDADTETEEDTDTSQDDE